MTHEPSVYGVRDVAGRRDEDYSSGGDGVNLESGYINVKVAHDSAKNTYIVLWQDWRVFLLMLDEFHNIRRPKNLSRTGMPSRRPHR